MVSAKGNALAGSGVKAKSKAAYKWLMAKRNWQLYLFILPATVAFAVFAYWPMYGILMAFKDFDLAKGILASPWANPWFKYFKLFFSGNWFRITLKNTVVLAAYGFIVGNTLPLLLALMINEVRNRKFQKTVQMVTYIPYFVSTVVVCGMIKMFFSNSGVVNQLIQMCGGSAFQFLTNDAAFKHLFTWSGVWTGTGYGSVIFFAALANVSPELHEAAVIDGASRFQRIIHINIPAVLPTFIIMMIMGAGSIMNVSYEKALLMQNDLNLQASEVINTYVYKLGIKGAKYSMSTAVSLFNNVINMVLMLTVNKISSKVSETSLW